MRRSRTVDWLLLASLLSAYAAIQVAALGNYLPHAGRWFAYSVTGAQGADGYPIVDRLNVPGIPLRVGDSLLSAGGVDLRGLSRAEVYRAQTPLLVAGRPYRVEVERGEERLAVDVELASQAGWQGKFVGLLLSCSRRSSCSFAHRTGTSRGASSPPWSRSARTRPPTLVSSRGWSPSWCRSASPSCSGPRSKGRRLRGGSGPGSARCPGCWARSTRRSSSCTSSARFQPGSGPIARCGA